MSGLRVVTTRQGGADPDVARILRPLGARVAGCPAIRREAIARPPGAARVVRGIRAFDLVVFTSAAAVRGFRSFCRRRGVRLAAASRTRYAAVGRRTAAAIRSVLGVRVSCVPGKFTGAALARSVGSVRGMRVLVPRALVAGEHLPRELARRGARVTVLPLYRTVPDRRGLSSLRRSVLAGRVDWVLFASASAARFAMRALGKRGRAAFSRGTRAASIGPVTGAEIRRWGVHPAVEADSSTMTGMARAIVRYHRKVHVSRKD